MRSPLAASNPNDHNDGQSKMQALFRVASGIAWCKRHRCAWRTYRVACIYPASRGLLQAAPGITFSAIQVNLVQEPGVSIDHAIMRSQVKHLAADIPPILKNELQHSYAGNLCGLVLA